VAAALLATAAAGAVGLGVRSRAPLCRGAERHLVDVWDEPRRLRVKAAFLDGNRPFAPDAWSESARALDDYSRAWTTMSTEACEATRVRGDQSDELLSLRMECLDRRLAELRSLTDLFASADATVVEKASVAARSLPSLATCADGAALRARVRPPEE